MKGKHCAHLHSYEYNRVMLVEVPIDLRIFAFDEGRAQFWGFVKINRKVALAFIVSLVPTKGI